MNDVQKMRNVPPFVKFVCANVPMVFDDSLSYYECLCALWKYVQGMTDVINNNATLEEEYIEKFDQLKNFVDTYFDNLDVQEEINNKLDAMAEAGTLEEIISAYIQTKAVWCFDSIADMKASSNLINGSFAKTIGYYSANDGGSAMYRIRQVTNTDTEDDAFIIALDNTNLVAELVIEESINIRSLGAKEREDIKPIVEKYLNFINTKNLYKRLYIPHGTWYCDELEITSWFDIYGESTFVGNTVIYPAVANQAYIIKISGDINRWNISGLHFETSGSKPLTDSVIILNETSYGNVSNMTFQNVVGRCIKNIGSFEINFYNTIARGCYPCALSDTTGLFTFKSTSSRIPSTLYFDYIQIEQVFGNIFYVEADTALFNNKVGSINIEQPSVAQGQTVTREIVAGLTLTAIEDEADVSFSTIANYKHHAVLTQTTSTQVSGLTIGSVDYNNVGSAVWNYNSKKYIFDCCLQKESSAENTNINFSGKIGNQTIVGMKKDFYLLNTRNYNNTRIDKTKNNIIFGDVEYANTGSNQCVCACKSEYNIKFGNIANPSIETANTEGYIECNKLIAPSYAFYGMSVGSLRYSEKALSKAKLILHPQEIIQNGCGFRVIAGDSKLRLRYKSSGTTNVRIIDKSKSDNNTQFVVNNTNDEFVYATVDLTGITDFAIGDELLIGSTGATVDFDLIRFI